MFEPVIKFYIRDPVQFVRMQTMQYIELVSLAPFALSIDVKFISI